MIVPSGQAKIISIYLLFCGSLILGPIRSACTPAFDFVFVRWPEWKVVKPGEKVQLTCATNLPPDSILWYYNHRPLSGSKQQHTLRSLGKNGSSLTIVVSKEQDIYRRQEGIYQCVSSVGPVSIISLPGRIEVAFLEKFPPTFVAHRSVLVPKEGIIIVPCRRPNSLPEAQIIFYKDGDILDTSDYNRYFTTDVGDLVILGTNESIQGTYSCSAYNQLLKETVYMNSSMEVIVESNDVKESFNLPFNFIYKNQSTVMKSVVVMLLCVQHGHQHPIYEWRRKNDSSLKMEPIKGQNSHLLQIAAEDSIYACHVKSPIGSTSSNISISVQDPPFIKVAPKHVSIHEGKNVSLECLFGGRPAPTVSWVFNGKFLGGRNFLAINNEISLTNISRVQTGIYQCFAFNPSGAAYGTSLVQVIPKTISYPHYNDLISASNDDRKNHRRKIIKHKKDRKKKQKRIKDKENLIPSKPSITKLTDESVLVSWNLIGEQSGNHSNILFYKVQFKTASRRTGQNTKWRTVSETIIPPATTCEVTGLSVNYYYRFRVAAVYKNNDHTFGPSSNKFFLEKFSRLQRPPNPPRIVAVESRTNNSIRIKWSYESQVYTEGFIVNYRRTGIMEEYNKIVLLGDMRRKFAVRNLKEWTPYDFKISSFNMAGISPYSDRKTLLPKNFRGYPSTGVNTSTSIPVVHSNQDMFSATHLTVGLGIALFALSVFVAVSFLLHGYKKRKKARDHMVALKIVCDKGKQLEEGQDSPFINRGPTCGDYSETLKLEDSLLKPPCTETSQ